MSGDQSNLGEPTGWTGNPVPPWGGGGTSAPNRTQSIRVNDCFAGLPTIPVWDVFCPN